MGRCFNNNSTTLPFLNPSAGNLLSSSTALITSFAFLIRNEHVSKLKKRYTKLKAWINVNTLLYEKTSKRPMIE